MDESTTKQLADILSDIHDEKKMEQFLSHPKVKDSFASFVPYYRSLPAVQTYTDPDLIKRSGIERSYYYQIMKETRKPSRDKILRLALGAGLTLRETTRCLELGGMAPLYPKNRRDIIITVAINQKAGVVDTNLLLDQYGEEVIG